MAPTREQVQERLKALGYYAGEIDGDFGNQTLQGLWDALATAQARVVVVVPAPTPKGSRVLPKQWLQPATIKRVHLHWTAGGHRASETDKDHYHVLVEHDGNVLKGNCDISANSAINPSGQKAHHTLNANTGAAAVSMCCMAGANQAPLSLGKFPLTKEQWDKAAVVVAELCYHYKVPVTSKTVLSHAEVQKNLGITQRGKWDVAILPWDRSLDTSWECGDQFRKQVQEHLNKL
jgi:hypothetical protein